MGAIASAANLAHGVSDFFADSEYEITYGSMVVDPILLQDDICRVTLSAERAQMGVSSLEALTKQK